MTKYRELIFTYFDLPRAKSLVQRSLEKTIHSDAFGKAVALYTAAAINSHN